MPHSIYILVTGCDSGFGNVVVKMLADRGFGIFATHLEAGSAQKLREAHSAIVPLQVDVTDQDSVDAMARSVYSRLETENAQLYGLVNNAGFLLHWGPVEWIPPENYERMFAVNVLGAVRVTTSLLPALRRSQGRIVNVASIAGRIAIPSQAAYCVSKHGLEAYSDCLRRELMDWGITVSIIEPGVFSTTGLYSTYADGIQRLWNGTAKSVQDDYGLEYKDALAARCIKALRECGCHDTSLVPRIMVRAMTERTVQYRYHVGPDAMFLLPFFKYFNEGLQDDLLGFEGPIWGAAMDRNAHKLAKAKYYRPKVFRKVAILFLVFWLIRKIYKM